MMPVVVLLKFMKPSSLVSGSINKVKGIVRHIINHIADKEKYPCSRIKDRILDFDKRPNKALYKYVV